MKKYRMRKLINGQCVAEIYTGFIFKKWKSIGWLYTWDIGTYEYNSCCIDSKLHALNKIAKYGVTLNDIIED